MPKMIFHHRISLALLIGLLVMIYAYVLAGMAAGRDPSGFSKGGISGDFRYHFKLLS
jgi:hypothetical protein